MPDRMGHSRLHPTHSAARSNRPKREKLPKTPRYFLTTHKIQNRPCRFDVVIIILAPTGKPQIRHYKNAFVP
jgi:Holliday junction resolvase-like predicted endonuclease